MEKEKREKDELHGYYTYNQNKPSNNNQRINILSDLKCNNCNKIGHVEKDCWRKNGFPDKFRNCTYCKIKGHTIDECRKKKYHDRRRFEEKNQYSQRNPGNETRPFTQSSTWEDKAIVSATSMEPELNNPAYAQPDTIVYTI